MFCNKCGAQLSDTAAFCNKCGTPTQAPTPIPQPQPVYTEAAPAKRRKKPVLIWILLLIIILLATVCIIFLKKAREADVLPDSLDNVMNMLQSSSLYGTWTDNSGTVSFTFRKDNTIRVSGLSDTLGANLFSFTEVDNNTLQLKADSDNPLLSFISLNMDYKITGDTMTIEIAGLTYKLTKQK